MGYRYTLSFRKHSKFQERERQITEAEPYIGAGIDPCQEKDGHILT